MKKYLSILFLLSALACQSEEPTPPSETEPEEVLDSHSPDAEPNFAEVFDDTQVQRLDIVIEANDWQSMLDNMASIYGNPGQGGGGPPGQFSDETPLFVAASVLHKDLEWQHVGVRFKGNSSLQNTWRNGNLKLSFKLDFDEFEDEFPEIENQRFHGFKKLSLKNNFDDPSFVREKVMADLFADAGMAVSHTAFYTLYVDHGEGPEYFGLYTLVEEIDNTVIKTQFENNDGNCYKPDGDGATFAEGTFDESYFEKKTNEDEADFSDIEALFAVLHDDDRLASPEQWRASLDEIFDTDVFLQYLAVNTVAQNWDTYGRMTHNYYLYVAPTTQKLTWIPWDNNEALQAGKRGGSLAFDFSDLDAGVWPLIEFLYQDDVYREIYQTHVQNFITGVFTAETMNARYDAYAELIESAATSERAGFTFLQNPQAFSTAINTLKTHAATRGQQAQSYLAQQ